MKRCPGPHGPGPHGPEGKCLSFPVTYAYSPSCLWGYVSSSALGTGKGLIPSDNLPNRLNRSGIFEISIE